MLPFSTSSFIFVIFFRTFEACKVNFSFLNLYIHSPGVPPTPVRFVSLDFQHLMTGFDRLRCAPERPCLLKTRLGRLPCQPVAGGGDVGSVPYLQPVIHFLFKAALPASSEHFSKIQWKIEPWKYLNKTKMKKVLGILLRDEVSRSQQVVAHSSMFRNATHRAN